MEFDEIERRVKEDEASGLEAVLMAYHYFGSKGVEFDELHETVREVANGSYEKPD